MTKAEKWAIKYAEKRGEDIESIDFENLYVKDTRFKKSVKGYSEAAEKPRSKFSHFSEMDLESHTQ